MAIVEPSAAAQDRAHSQQLHLLLLGLDACIGRGHQGRQDPSAGLSAVLPVCDRDSSVLNSDEATWQLSNGAPPCGCFCRALQCFRTSGLRQARVSTPLTCLRQAEAWHSSAEQHKPVSA